jgi:hypothetical protein
MNLDKDYKKIINFVNDLHKNLQNELKDKKKLNNLKKSINIQKLKVMKKKLSKNKKQNGGNPELSQNLQNLINYGNIISSYSTKLNETTYGLEEILKNFPMFLDEKGIKSIVHNLKFNGNNKLRTTQTKNLTKQQKGGNHQLMQSIGLNYIQSMVYMSEVIQYISLWVNSVNDIVINNQLGMSDKCLENTKVLMESLGNLTSKYPQPPSAQIIGATR